MKNLEISQQFNAVGSLIEITKAIPCTYTGELDQKSDYTLSIPVANYSKILLQIIGSMSCENTSRPLRIINLTSISNTENGIIKNQNMIRKIVAQIAWDKDTIFEFFPELKTSEEVKRYIQERSS